MFYPRMIIVSCQLPSWSTKVFITAQKFATDSKGCDTTWEIKMVNSYTLKPMSTIKVAI